MNANTVVTDAEGRIRVFADWLSKAVVAHPKKACAVFLLVGIVVGRLI